MWASTPGGRFKRELLAQVISERAAKLGIDPKKLRDDVLTGKVMPRGCSQR